MKRISATGWFVLPVGLCFRLVCASGWFVLPAGLCFRLVCASGWFVLPVGLCERKSTNVHPILTVMFKIILRTFEAEILKIFKNIQPQPKN